MWYPNYNKQYCTSQEEIFSWNTVLYPMSQFLHKSEDDLNYHIAKKHSAPKTLLLSSVNFVIKSFLDFTLYVNTEILNMEHKLGSERTILTWKT